jgi:hypothetical protein
MEMANMVKFEEIDRNSGVDSLKPGPRWIMVPEGKSNICLPDRRCGVRHQGG